MAYSTHLYRHLRFVIGRNINRYRVAQGLTLEELARMTGTSASRLDRYELGNDDISLHTVFKIACVLRKGFGDMVAELA